MAPPEALGRCEVRQEMYERGIELGDIAKGWRKVLCWRRGRRKDVRALRRLGRSRHGRVGGAVVHGCVHVLRAPCTALFVACSPVQRRGTNGACVFT